MEDFKPMHVWAVEWHEDVCRLIDQKKLPAAVEYIDCTTYEQVVEGIKNLTVRGAPAIGVAGAYAACLAAKQAFLLDESHRRAFLRQALNEIEAARPTAVNLHWAVSQMRTLLEKAPLKNLDEVRALARHIHQEDVGFSRKMAFYGAALFEPHSRIVTYCNTGDLATGGGGTALGVVVEAYRQGKVEMVYACETRPVLQGARLTAWELAQTQVPYKLICDNMAASIIREKKISAVVLGADRIAANGDVANKIGSYGLAIFCKHHGIPFYVVAPSSTFDLTLSSGDQIPIEQRDSSEVLSVLLESPFRSTVEVENPAFDVTPHELVTAIVCERGVIHSPSASKIEQTLGV